MVVWTTKEERISMYLDGQMSEEQMQQFEADLGTDIELAKALEAFQAHDELLRGAFPVQIVDDAFIARMGLAKPCQDVGSHSAEILTASPANDNPPFWRKWAISGGGAVAAGLALMLYFGVGSGYEGQLNVALNNTPSGTIAAMPNDGSLSPLLTFKAGDGRYCREFAEQLPSGGRTAIACRDGGNWKIEASVKGAVRLADNGQILPASGAEGEALDAAYNKIKASDPLSLESEARLIASDWK